MNPVEPGLAEGERRTRNRKRWFLGLRIAVTVTLLAFLATNYLPLELLRTSGWQLAPAVLFGLAMLIVTLLLSAVRWYVIGRVIDAPLGMARGTALVFIGQFFNQVLPTSFGGDAVRALGAWSSGLTVQRAVTSVTLDRFSGLTGLLIFVALGLPILALRLQNPWLAAAGLAVVLAVPVGVVIVARLSRLAILQGEGRLPSFLRDISGGVARLVERPLLAIVVLALSLLVHCLAIVLTVAIANALGSPIGLVDGLLILPSVLFIASLPISIAGWGVREAGLAGGFVLLGFPGDVAITTSILAGLINIVAGLPGAILFLFEKDRSRPIVPPS